MVNIPLDFVSGNIHQHSLRLRPGGRGLLQANRWEIHHYQCDVTSYITTSFSGSSLFLPRESTFSKEVERGPWERGCINGFQNGAEICCTLSTQKYGIFNGLADPFPTFFLNQDSEKHRKHMCIIFFDV